MKWFNAHLFRKFFAIRIYKENLLSPGTEQWMFIARVIVFIMALTEALSWGYLGSLFGSGAQKWTTATFSGLLIFLVIWMVDISLMNLDRYRRFYHKYIFDMEEKEEKERMSVLMRFWKMYDIQISVALRTGMVALSIVVTAPFLSQFIFREEIAQVIEAKKETVIALKRDSIARTFDMRMDSVRRRMEGLSQELLKEVAGKGLSGRYGNGPATSQFQDQIKAERNRLGQLERNKKDDLNRFDQAVVSAGISGNYQNLRRKWNVEVPQNSFVERSKAIKPIMESDDARRTEIAIRSFLSFLFLALLLLKFFEPRSVRIYLSEALQQAYITYKNGGYDAFIPADERFGAKAAMQPFRFEQFMVDTYPVISKRFRENHFQEERARTISDLEKKIAHVEEFSRREQERRASTLNQLRHETEAHEKKVRELEDQKHEYEMFLENLHKEIEYVESRAKAMEYMTVDNGRPAQVNAPEAIVTMTQKVAEMRHGNKEVHARKEQKRTELKKLQREIELWQNRLKKSKDALAQEEKFLEQYDLARESLHKELLDHLLSSRESAAFG